jgi:hypothetical protein
VRTAVELGWRKREGGFCSTRKKERERFASALVAFLSVYVFFLLSSNKNQTNLLSSF